MNGGETLLICGDGFDQPELKRREKMLPLQPSREEWPQAAVQRASLERTLDNVGVPRVEPEGRLNSLSVSRIDHTPARAASRWRLPASPGDPSPHRERKCGASRHQSAAALVGVARVSNSRWVCSHLRTEFVLAIWQRCCGVAARCQWRVAPLENSLPRGVLPGYDGGLTQPYEIDVTLPEDLPPGDCEIFVHNGSGGDLGWSQPLKIKVCEFSRRSRTIVKASDFGAIPNDDKSDSSALEKALQAAAENADKGIVQLEAGVYHLSGNLRLPPGTILRGVSKTGTTVATLNGAPMTAAFPQENFPDQDAGYYKAVTGVGTTRLLPASGPFGRLRTSIVLPRRACA